MLKILMDLFQFRSQTSYVDSWGEVQIYSDNRVILASAV